MACDALSILPNPSDFHCQALAAIMKDNGRDAPRVLIVEDEYLIACQADEALHDAGFSVVGIAATGAEAVLIAKAEKPLLAIMDIRLKGPRNGLDVALEIFELFGIRCLFATAHHDLEIERRAALARPLGWLQKPYTVDMLVALTRRSVAELQSKQGDGSPSPGKRTDGIV